METLPYITTGGLGLALSDYDPIVLPSSQVQMLIILCVQYYRALSAARQAEIDACLVANVANPIIDHLYVFAESDSLPSEVNASGKVEVLPLAQRLMFSDWLCLLPRKTDAIYLLSNSDIAFGDDLHLLKQALSSPMSVMALTRHNPVAGASPMLNKFPQWTQDSWAIRTDALMSQSLLSSCHIPLGYPGSDNRVAHAFWSHGFEIVNPCYFIKSVHHHAEPGRSYDKIVSRIYGGATYVHPSLGVSEPADLEHVLWSKSKQPVSSIVLNRQAVALGLTDFFPFSKGSNTGDQDRLKFNHLLSKYHLCVTTCSEYASVVTPLDHLSVLLEVPMPEGHMLAAIRFRASVCFDTLWRLTISLRSPTTGQWELVDFDNELCFPSDGKSHISLLNQHQHISSAIRFKFERQSVKTGSGLLNALELLVFSEPWASSANPASINLPRRKNSPSTSPFIMEIDNHDYATSIQPVLSSSLDISTWRIQHVYDNRFVLYANKHQHLFWDRFWPTCYLSECSNTTRKSLTEDQLLRMFISGFVPTALEWKPNFIKNVKSYASQIHFWQFPCKTEADAFERHKNLGLNLPRSNTQSMYVGLPWATWIDLKAFPANILRAYGRRISSVKHILSSRGLTLSVHTICQHIFWQKYLQVFNELGITDLWVSHKRRDSHDTPTIKIHSWPLYPVNTRDPSRRQGLRFISADKKPILASFRGAHMDHYITCTRQLLKSLSDKSDFVVELTDAWHFNPLVYDHQVLNTPLGNIKDLAADVLRYNELLSLSVFSLCPAGAGPNTLRLWESLSIGSIPVILSDEFQPPVVPPVGCTPWLLHPESSLDTLEQRLRSFRMAELLKMQSDAVAYSEMVDSLTCF